MRPTARPRRSTRSPQPQQPYPDAAVTRPQSGHERPPLPLADANPLLLKEVHKSRHAVKTQELKLAPKSSILIARMKVPTPQGVPGHLIKRFDTDSVSASTFFRVAFPTSSPASEEEEMTWVRSKYNCVEAGNEGLSSDLRLTGTWVSTRDGIELARDYGLEAFAVDLINFVNPFGSKSNQEVEDEPVVVPSSRSSTRKALSPSPRNDTSSHTVKKARMASPRSAKKPTTPTSFSAFKEEQPSEPVVVQDMITVTVTSVSHDPLTGSKIEDTNAASLVGSDEQVAAAREEARELVASLKDAAQKVAAASTPPSSPTQTLKRHLDDDQVDNDEEVPQKRNFLRRIWRRRRDANTQLKAVVAVKPQISDRVSPETRRSIALVGLAVAGVAASVLPYVFQ